MELKDLRAKIDGTQSLTGSDGEGVRRKRRREEATIADRIGSDDQSEKRVRRET